MTCREKNRGFRIPNITDSDCYLWYQDLFNSWCCCIRNWFPNSLKKDIFLKFGSIGLYVIHKRGLEARARSCLAPQASESIYSRDFKMVLLEFTIQKQRQNCATGKKHFTRWNLFCCCHFQLNYPFFKHLRPTSFKIIPHIFAQSIFLLVEPQPHTTYFENKGEVFFLLQILI